MAFNPEVLKTGLKIADLIAQIAVPIVKTIAPKLQKGTADFAERLLTLSEKYSSLEPFAEKLAQASEVFGDVLYALGLKQESAEKTAMRAEKSEKSASEFESSAEYIKYLQNEIEVTDEEVEQLTLEQRVGYQATGVAMQAGVVEEAFKIKIVPGIVILSTALKAVSETIGIVKGVQRVFEGLKEQGITDMGDVIDYFTGHGTGDRVKIGQVINKVFQNAFGEQAPEVVLDVKNRVRKEWEPKV